LNVHARLLNEVAGSRRRKTQKIDCRLHAVSGTVSPLTHDLRITALPRPALDEEKEVSAVTNTYVAFPHAWLDMPVSSRARKASLRALPMTSGAVAVASPVLVPTDAAVITGAFQGTTAWSPPI
jgi:hypothetical protein